jgi:hypothetical protein
MAAFEYRQALKIRDACARHQVKYLFIGKSGGGGTGGREDSLVA